VVVAVARLGITVFAPPSGRFLKTIVVKVCAEAILVGAKRSPVPTGGYYGRLPILNLPLNAAAACVNRAPTPSAEAKPPRGEKCGLDKAGLCVYVSPPLALAASGSAIRS